MVPVCATQSILSPRWSYSLIVQVCVTCYFFWSKIVLFSLIDCPGLYYVLFSWSKIVLFSFIHRPTLWYVLFFGLRLCYFSKVCCFKSNRFIWCRKICFITRWYFFISFLPKTPYFLAFFENSKFVQHYCVYGKCPTILWRAV